MKAILIALLPCWMLVLAGSVNLDQKNSKGSLIKIDSPNYSSSATIDDIIEGRYKIRAANTTNKYLDVDNGSRGETVRINRIGNTTKDNIWDVRKVVGIAEGYTIESVRYPGRFLDADILRTNIDGCKVQLWNRTGLNGNLHPLDHGSPISLNQEWHINLISGNKYSITNVQSPRMKLDAKDDGAADSRVKLWKTETNDKSQIWIFEKVD